MKELILLYQWTLLAGVMAAPLLALIGTHLATRDTSMQTLCIGQGAMVGVLLGLGLLHALEDTFLGSFGPFLLGLALSTVTFMITDRLVSKRVASKNTYFALIFALLLAMSHLISALFPALESHMAQIYFGDLATLSILNSKIVFYFSVGALIALLFLNRSITNTSFEIAIYGTPNSTSLSTLVFKLLTLVVLCFSVQFVGFLYTISMLFLPTGLLSFLHTKRLKHHLVLCGFISVLSAFFGFLISLKFTRLPTVPTIVLFLFVNSVVIIFIERFYLGIRAFIGRTSLDVKETLVDA